MAAFTPGDLVIYRVGTGATSLSSAATAVFLDEYTATRVLVQSIALPTADSGSNQTLTASGTATSEGLLTLSADGRYLELTGYNAAVRQSRRSLVSSHNSRLNSRAALGSPRFVRQFAGLQQTAGLVPLEAPAVGHRHG